MIKPFRLEDGLGQASPDDGIASLTNGFPVSAPVMLNVVHGTNGNDFFHVQGDGEKPPPGYNEIDLLTNSGDVIYTGAGDDIVYCGSGNDIVNFGPYLTPKDEVFGLGDYNQVVLDGDYSAQLSLTSKTLYEIQEIDVKAGHSYNLKFDDTVANTAWIYFVVDGTDLRSGNSLTVNAAAETTEGYKILGGAGSDYLVGSHAHSWLDGGPGNDVLKGGAAGDLLIGGLGDNLLYGNGGADIFELTGNDTAFGGAGYDVFDFPADGSFSTADHIDGGLGVDSLSLSGSYPDKIVLTGATLVSIEQIFMSGGPYNLVADDSLVPAGHQLWVNDREVSAEFHVTFDGSAESDGHFLFWGGEATETYVGGRQNDVFDMGGYFANTDHIDGGPGNDTLILSFSPNVVFTDATMVNVETIQLSADNNYYSGASLTMSDGNVAAGQTLKVDGSALYFGPLLFDGRTKPTVTFPSSAEAATTRWLAALRPTASKVELATIPFRADSVPTN